MEHYRKKLQYVYDDSATYDYRFYSPGLHKPIIYEILQKGTMI